MPLDLPSTRAQRPGRHAALGVTTALLLLMVVPPGHAEPPTSYTVEEAPLLQEAVFHGELVARESILIHAPELPRIAYLTVAWVLEDGVAVNRDDPVLRFEPDEVQDGLEDAGVELNIARAQRDRTRLSLEAERIGLQLQVRRKAMAVERARLLVQEGAGIVSKLELRRAKLDLEAAELEHAEAQEKLKAFAAKLHASMKVEELSVEAAQAKVDRLTGALAALEVKAPAAGVVYRPFVQLGGEKGRVEKGKVVRPGDLLLELPDLAAFDARLWLKEPDAAAVQIGDVAAVVLTALPGQRRAARVTAKDEFATTLNERRGTKVPEGALKEVEVTLELAEADPLMRPGMTLRAKVRSQLSEGCLSVPLMALHGPSGKVFVYKQGLIGPERTPVEIGRSTSAWVEITRGVSAGDEVLLVVPGGR